MYDCPYNLIEEIWLVIIVTKAVQKRKQFCPNSNINGYRNKAGTKQLPIGVSTAHNNNSREGKGEEGGGMSGRGGRVSTIKIIG